VKAAQDQHQKEIHDLQQQQKEIDELKAELRTLRDQQAK